MSQQGEDRAALSPTGKKGTSITLSFGFCVFVLTDFSFQPISRLRTRPRRRPVGRPIRDQRASFFALAREKRRGKVGQFHQSEVEHIIFFFAIFSVSVLIVSGVVANTCQLAVEWYLSLSLCPAGDAAAAPQNQEEAPAAPPLVGEDAELVEQLRRVCTSLCCNWTHLLLSDNSSGLQNRLSFRF